MNLYSQDADSAFQEKENIRKLGHGWSVSFKYIENRTSAYEIKYNFTMPKFKIFNDSKSGIAMRLIKWQQNIKPNIAIGYQNIRDEFIILSNSSVNKFSGNGIYTTIGSRIPILKNIIYYSTLMQIMYINPDNNNYQNNLILSFGGYVDFWLNKKSYFSIGYLNDSRDLFKNDKFYPLRLRSTLRWTYFLR